MKVGELFVDLGIKGSEKTIGALTATKDGLKGAASLSLEAKAAIAGVFYGLEQLMSISGKTGTSLTNFGALIGTSTKTLQEYQYAARQVGIANEDVSSSFLSIQSAMTKQLTTGSGGGMLAMVARLTGGMSNEDIKQFQLHPELLLQKLQEYSDKEKNLGLRNEVLESFVSKPVAAALARGAFRPGAFKNAGSQMYNDREIGALNRANQAWMNLGVTIEMAVGHFNAAHGGQLVNDITKLIKPTIKLAEAFGKLADSVKIFALMGKAVEFMAGVINAITASLPGYKDAGKNEKTFGKGSDVAKFLNFRDKIDSTILSFMKGAPNPAAPDITPNMPLATAGAGGSQQNVNVQQHLHFQHDGRDHARLGDASKRGINAALRQMPAGGQGS